MNWDFQPPPDENINDSQVKLKSSLLTGKKICLLVCGSIAAYKSPDIVRELRRHGAEVFVTISKEAQSFVTPMTLEWCSNNKVIKDLTADAEHLAGDKKYDLYLVAPATYNTINKFACGIADTPILVTLASALGQLENRQAKIVLAPCLHGSMHNSVFVNNLKRLKALKIEIMKPRQEEGKNKLPEPAEIADYICQLFKN